MPANPVPWPIEPHTRAKHALYRLYLSKWFPIMASGWGGNVTYAEGFAGPGVYDDGSPGSPVIALQVLLGDERLRTRYHKMRLLFVDHDSRCIDMLPGQLEIAARPVPLVQLAQYGIEISVQRGECDPTLEQLLTERHAWGRPMLVVLDTWGGAVPIALVRRIAENISSEVLITIQPQYFSRFAEVDAIGHGDEVFGSADWRKVHELPSDQKARWLLQHYRNVIRDAGFAFVLDFELIDTRGQALYLVFGTTHVRGLQKMKEAMWDVDDISGVGYRDPRDPDQQTLAIVIEPNTEPLKRLLLEELRLKGNSGETVHRLRRFALLRTVFKESQVLPALRSLQDVGLIETIESGQVGYKSTVRVPQAV